MPVNIRLFIGQVLAKKPEDIGVFADPGIIEIHVTGNLFSNLRYNPACLMAFPYILDNKKKNQ